MKNSIFLCALFLFLGLTSFSQEINKLSDNQTINKGKITLRDGTTIKFQNLIQKDGMIIYKDSQGNPFEKKSSDVFKVVKTGTYAGWGALIGGLTGLVTCLSISTGVDPYASPYNVKQYTSTSSGISLTAGEWIIVTGGEAALFGLIGLCFKREQTVFKNNSALSFYPSLNSTMNGNYFPMLSMKINFR